MDKWAHFLVSRVRYNKERTRIELVERHEDLGDSVGPPKEIARSLLVDDIEAGRSYRTIRKGDEGRWEPGPTLRVVARGKERIVRVDGRELDEDDLGWVEEI